MVATLEQHRSVRTQLRRIRKAKARTVRGTTHRTPNVGNVQTASLPDGVKLFDRQARMELDISGDEFLRRWDRGDYRDDDSDTGQAAGRLAMLIPFARRTPV